MKTILVLMDTLKRDMLTCYNPNTFVKTPNLNKFSQLSTTFDQHWLGSAPCMPARRDILTGRLNFLERSWGPIEPFDVTLPSVLKKHNIFSHITTDHCHYFRLGGENYVQQFSTWDYHRGQEGDPWISRIDDPQNIPSNYYGKVRTQYQWNRTMWENEEDYPSAKTFASACNWLEDNQNNDDFFLMVEAFDPHEPFDVPNHYMKEYEDTSLDREYYEIPDYARVDVPDSAIDYIQKRYAALLTMTDAWFGKLIDKLHSLNIYEETMVIVSTDHGYFLGERDYLGKNYMHCFNELAHLPMIIKFPDQKGAGQRINQLTQNIDLMPTILEMHNCELPNTIKGVSLKCLIDQPEHYHKEYALFGYHGLAVNITDGHKTYFRAPNRNNMPLFEYTCIPTTIRKYLGVGNEERIEMGHFLSRCKYPMYKIPITYPSILDNNPNGLVELKESKLFDLDVDYAQTKNLVGQQIEKEYIELLKKALDENESPSEQKLRLDLE